MAFKSRPPFSHRMKALVPVIFLCLCSLSVSCTPWASHGCFPTPAPLSKVPSGEGLGLKQGMVLRELLKPALLWGGGCGKEEHPKTLGKTLLLSWCKNTACASAGLTQAVRRKPWALAGIRWLVLNTFTGEWWLKEQNQCAKQTSHCQLPVQWTWA